LNKQEIRTLRAQLLLTGGLMLLCAVCAVVVATQRKLVERKWIREKYTAAYDNFPRRVQEAADAAAAGKLTEKLYEPLSEKERDWLYEDWMIRSDPPFEAAPSALAGIDAVRYLERAERTLVCGSAPQQQRAARFLELCATPAAAEVAVRVHDWARKRNRQVLAERLAPTIETLKKEAGKREPLLPASGVTGSKT
jgi:hypothetical protein